VEKGGGETASALAIAERIRVGLTGVTLKRENVRVESGHWQDEGAERESNKAEQQEKRERERECGRVKPSAVNKRNRM
jgi:hypothetical protein